MSGKSVYEHIHPKKYFREHVLQGVRPDGRKLLSYRPVALNVDIISKADGSATLKIGSSVFVCGINPEISCSAPSSHLMVTVSCPTLQPSENECENLSDKLVLCSNLITELYKDQNILKPEDLTSSNGKAFWVLYCDILCTNYDGALLDGGLMVLAAALKTIKLPSIIFYNNSDDFYVDTNKLNSLVIERYPVATTYGIFDGSVILVDPSSKEEKLCSLSELTIVTLGEELCAVHKHGSTTIPQSVIVPCMNQALKRSPLVIKVIDKVLSNK